MNTSELLKKVRKIEIKTRGLSHNIFAGEYHSAFKGRGMAFSEVREYQVGDDIRSIDWNVTARLNAPYIKVFEEERELTVMLLVDVSASEVFGTTQKLKRDLMAELAAVLSFSAGINNDKVGVIFFSDKIEKFIPPKKGRSHTLRIIRELLDFEPTSNRTDVSEVLRFFTNAMKKRCTAFLISDMLDVEGQSTNVRFEKPLRIAARKHDVVAIRVLDPREKTFPQMGLVQLKDAETGQEFMVDSLRRSVRKRYAEWWKGLEDNLSQTFLKCNVRQTSVSTDEDYVRPLINLFKQR